MVNRPVDVKLDDTIVVGNEVPVNSLAAIVDHAGADDIAPVPDCVKYFLVVV